jgi:LytS/YehU family sensor histidine kinase
LLQTLVENAVKHGISNLSAGGEVRILANISDHKMIITVINSGSYKPSPKRRSTGIGLENSIKRLSIIFGDRAILKIGNEKGIVKAQIELPLNE